MVYVQQGFWSVQPGFFVGNIALADSLSQSGGFCIFVSLASGCPVTWGRGGGGGGDVGPWWQGITLASLVRLRDRPVVRPGPAHAISRLSPIDMSKSIFLLDFLNVCLHQKGKDKSSFSHTSSQWPLIQFARLK